MYKSLSNKQKNFVKNMFMIFSRLRIPRDLSSIILCSYSQEAMQYIRPPLTFSQNLSDATSAWWNDIGPRQIPGWRLKDVEDKGNCFYLAITDQLKIINYQFKEEIPLDIQTHVWLRTKVEGTNYQDRRWATDKDFDQFVKIFPELVLAVIDTRVPEQGYTYYYCQPNDEGEESFIVIATKILPEFSLKQKVIKIAATGDHFLSVITEGCNAQISSPRCVA